MEGWGGEAELDAVGVEECGVLLDEGVTRFGQDGDELGLGQGMEGSDDWNATEEFGDEAIGLEVTGEDGVEGIRRWGGV